MVIHHDKMAYGKIKPLQDDLDQTCLAAMVKQLSAEEEKPEDERSAVSTAEGQNVGKKT